MYPARTPVDRAVMRLAGPVRVLAFLSQGSRGWCGELRAVWSVGRVLAPDRYERSFKRRRQPVIVWPSWDRLRPLPLGVPAAYHSTFQRRTISLTKWHLRGQNSSQWSPVKHRPRGRVLSVTEIQEALSDDPFDEVAPDAPAMTPLETVTTLLDSAKRGYVPLRKVFVQKERTEKERAAKLAELVHGRHQRPIDAFLLIHALEPILGNNPFSLRTWARMMSTKTHCSPSAASKAFDTLLDLNLVSRKQDGHAPVIRPLHEGTGGPWSRPGEDDNEGGPGYFTLPHAYWTSGYADRLTLPGKAMLLIILSETQSPTKKTFAMPVSKAQAWYGISERTAERGYRELTNAGVLLTKIQKVPDARHPAGRREIYHRALDAPFSTFERARLQGQAQAAAQKNAPTADTTNLDGSQ